MRSEVGFAFWRGHSSANIDLGLLRRSVPFRESQKTETEMPAFNDIARQRPLVSAFRDGRKSADRREMPRSISA